MLWNHRLRYNTPQGLAGLGLRHRATAQRLSLCCPHNIPQGHHLHIIGVFRLQDGDDGAEQAGKQAAEQAIELDDEAVDLVDDGASVGADQAADEAEDGLQDGLQSGQEVGDFLPDDLLDFCNGS